jgi:hypothetical protein
MKKPMRILYHRKNLISPDSWVTPDNRMIDFGCHVRLNNLYQVFKVFYLVLAHGSNGSIRIKTIPCNFDTNHIGFTSNPNFISLQVDLIQMFLDFLLKTTGLTRSVSICWIREPILILFLFFQIQIVISGNYRYCIPANRSDWSVCNVM